MQESASWRDVGADVPNRGAQAAEEHDAGAGEGRDFQRLGFKSPDDSLWDPGVGLVASLSGIRFQEHSWATLRIINRMSLLVDLFPPCTHIGSRSP